MATKTVIALDNIAEFAEKGLRAAIAETKAQLVGMENMLATLRPKRGKKLLGMKRNVAARFKAHKKASNNGHGQTLNERVLAVFGGNDALDRQEVALRANLSAQQASNALTQLRKAKKVVSTPKGWALSLSERS